jgi:hypothetical protein
MPDIAVQARGGRMALVLDPKHGFSYRRSKVQDVLKRYAENLEADLTVIVNYFPIPSYTFEAVRWEKRRWLLASDISPSTANLRRLEINFADVLLERGYGRFSKPVIYQASEAVKAPPKAAALVYWAEKDREVDEPAGFWMLGEEGGLQHLPALTKWAQEAPDALAANASGEACVLGIGEKLILLRRGQKPKTLGEWHRFESIAWNPQGTLFCHTAGDHISIFDQMGEQKSSIEPQGHCLGWDDGGEALLSYQVEGFKHVAIYRSTELSTWTEIWSGDLSSSYGYRDVTCTILGPHQGTVIHLTPPLLLRAGRLDLAPEEDRAVLSASNHGRYRIQNGPRSRRRDEEVSLLSIQDTSAPARDKGLPLVRFFGEVKDAICWSPDDSRFAFLARRSDRSLEDRLLSVRVGERHALTVSMPGQSPTVFAWVGQALIRPYI